MANLVSVQPQFLQAGHVSEHGRTLFVGLHVRNLVVLKVQLSQLGQIEQRFSLEDEEAVVTEVKGVKRFAKLPPVVSYVVHFVSGQGQVTQSRQPVKPPCGEKAFVFKDNTLNFYYLYATA